MIRRAATVFHNKSARRRVASAGSALVDEYEEAGLIRILVLDSDSATIDQLDDALWVWPHKLSVASNLAHAVKMCAHLDPRAIVVSLDFPCSDPRGLIPALRAALPFINIIALGHANQVTAPGKFLDQGADLIIEKKNLHQSRFYDQLMRLENRPRQELLTETNSAKGLSMPWVGSQLLGCLVCDIDGKIMLANRRLASMLDYPNAEALLGKRVLDDLLASYSDWEHWVPVAGDPTAIVQQTVSIRARNNQFTVMQVEVFAAQDYPLHLQAVFVDKSESMLMGV